MKNLKNKMKSMNGITLIALVITIVIMIILAGVAISTMLGDDGLLNRTKTATEEYNKQTATESINLKITTCQMNTYAETQRMPTLKELAVELEKDNEIQYVNGSQRVASTQDINFTTATSIFTKLKAYPYEFEINSSLQLASIDGIQVASIPANDDDTIVSMTKKELRKMIQDEISAATPSPSTNASNNYSTDEQIVGTWTNGKPLYQKTVDCGAITSSTGMRVQFDYDTVISNIEHIHLLSAYATTGYTLPCIVVNDLSYSTDIAIEMNAHDLYIMTGRDRSGQGNVITTIQYTKTTDQTPTQSGN